MKLNLLERIFIVSPLKRFIQKHLEARQLLHLGGPAVGLSALEIGCGSGFGIDLIRDLFQVARIDAFDLDLQMIKRVSQHRRHQATSTNLWVGNVRRIPVADASYGAVFNFGAIHHVRVWRSAIKEIYRVLKPGGRFYCEEILERYITHPVWGQLMDHPQDDRFDQPTFLRALEATGFQITGHRQLAQLYLWVVAIKK